MIEEYLKGIKGPSELNSKDILTMNPLVFAYIGDAVYEVYVRTHIIVSEPNKTVHKMHLMSTGYVKAHTQSDYVHKLSNILTEEEQDIVRRGRNSKSGYVPKNADVVEYRNATGFEALVGYLYLTGNIKRLEELLNFCIMGGQET